ncbi:7-cyano-7-deazaguanine synthase [Brevundimonas phage vB_BpoS-StAshley]|nr:7-cyano-7-deazaguanine synthase [Brevundimonas phage vB_BpoS-StAshley]UTC30128.1 7-cyano-7-deazaguanine synthase [Brevundimonas phage vB_BpoS-MaInes]
MVDKVYVLLSGGVDSSAALGLAKLDFPDAQFEAVTIDYGQRHDVELQAAKDVADHFQVPHVIIDAKGFMSGLLVKADPVLGNAPMPNVSYDDLPKGISPTYVTFRNGLMLSILAARAQGWVMEQERADQATKHVAGELFEPTEFNAYIYLGIHADDGANWAYPDCTQEFIGPMSAAIYTGTYNRVRVRAPFTFMQKSVVVQLGEMAGVPWEKTWSCYQGGEVHCGVCPTCRSRKDAFKILKGGGVDISDPTIYAV